jgi:PAP2 superfamily
MRRLSSIPLFVLVLVLSVAIASVAAAAPSGSKARSGAVTSWIELELEEIASHRVNPPRAARALALVSVAMHRAAAAGGPAPKPAVAGAASTVLAYLFPDEAERLLRLGRSNASGHGFAIGRRIGEEIVDRAKTDGSNVVWTGTVPVGPGLWVPTPPGFLPPLEPLAGTWRTWNLASGSQLRPEPPPAFGSDVFVAELDEVYAVSQALTDEQKRIADFWADGAGTVTPPGHWNAIALELVGSDGRSELETARLFATLNTAQADAFIACWDAKFTYWSLRPITAIRALVDADWSSYIVTPPFPSYVSGHSTTSGAAATVLSSFFPRSADELSAMAEEAALSRLYGGIHFTSDNDAGLELGRRVAEIALAEYD